MTEDLFRNLIKEKDQRIYDLKSHIDNLPISSRKIDLNINNNFPITKIDEDNLKLKINTSLFSNIETRKSINIIGCDVLKIGFFSCCNNKRDKIIGNALDYTEKCSESN